MACELHVLHAHQPVPLTFDQHHVIPQAWQHFAVTGDRAAALHVEAVKLDALKPGTFELATMPVLFDPRTVGVGPTCHRNVHHYIVALMRALDGNRNVLTPAVTQLVRRRERVKGRSLHAAEFECATLALVRYAAAGYELSRLADAGLWGEA